MGIVLLDLVEIALRIAKQALGKQAGKAHIEAHCIRKKEDHNYAELVDRLSLMPTVSAQLGHNPDASPNPTTCYRTFDRCTMYIWRALLRILTQQYPQSGHVALDSTFFERHHTSQYDLQRQGQNEKTIKARIQSR